MLVAITLSFVLGGLLAITILRPQQQANAAAAVQYKVVDIASFRTEALESALNTYGGDGWDLVQLDNPSNHFIFKK